jgi:preprotein translocase subunit SecF
VNLKDAMWTFRGHRVPHFDIVGRKRLWFSLSAAFIVLSLGGLLIRQLNLSLEFQGGAELRYPNRSGQSVEDVRATMAEFGRGDAEIQIVGGGDIAVTTSSLNDLGNRREALLTALADGAGVAPDEININDVGPTFGGQIATKAVRALLIFLVLVTGYIALRFEWKMALSAQAALIHDLLITAGVYALVGREVTPATVIAILTILGYSLYDTVVIFDKVKENTESMAMVARDTYSGVVNTSLNETLMRSVNTSLVVVLPILALLLFGGETLKDFAFALLIGVLCGTYSSIFVASPILAVLKEREPRIASLRARAARTGARPSLKAVPGDAVAAAPASPPRAAETLAAELEPAAATPSPKRQPVSSGGRPGGSKPRTRRKPPAKRRRR